MTKTAFHDVATRSVGLWTDTTDTDRQAQRQSFHDRYKLDPVRFVVDVIDFPRDERPADYQLEILDQIVQKRRVCVRGPHGLGKSAVSSWAILWFCLSRDGFDDWKVPTTASAWRQLTKFLWPEIHKWSRRIRWEVVGRDPFNTNTELLSLSMKMDTGEAFALASHDSSLIEGAHADEIMYVFDESKVIPDATWDSAEGAMSVGNAYWLAVSTPGEPIGRFYDIQSRKPGYEDWWVRAVKKGEAIKAGRMSGQWADNRRRQWGKDSPRYKNRVEGEFAESEEDSVIPLSWVEAAQDRWSTIMDAGYDLGPLSAVGIDVARYGDDKTAFAYRHGPVVARIERFEKEDTMATAGRAVAILRANPSAIATIDVIGVGAGTKDRTQEEHPERTIAFNAAKGTDFVDRTEEWRFVDTRSAAWWHLRDLLDPASDNEIALPDDDLLTGDLVSPRWRVQSGGRIKVESKQDIRKRLGRSTNDGDSVVQAYWDEDAESGMEFA